MRKSLIFIILGMFMFSGCGMYETIVEPQNISNNIITEPTDSLTGAILTIDYVHHETHEGSNFKYKDHYMLNKNAVKEFIILTPNTSKEAHLIYEIDATTSTIIVEFFENPTYSNIGVIEPVFNRNRNSNKTDTTVLYENPVIISTGNELESGIYGAGKNSDGGGTRDDNEIILRQGTPYLLRITENNIVATNVNILFDWYEHTNNN